MLLTSDVLQMMKYEKDTVEAGVCIFSLGVSKYDSSDAQHAQQ